MLEIMACSTCRAAKESKCRVHGRWWIFSLSSAHGTDVARIVGAAVRSRFEVPLAEATVVKQRLHVLPSQIQPMVGQISGDE